MGKARSEIGAGAVLDGTRQEALVSLHFGPKQDAGLDDIEDHVGGKAEEVEDEDADENLVGEGKSPGFHTRVAEAGRRSDDFGDDQICPGPADTI